MENYIKRGMTIYSFKQLVAEGKLTWGEAIGNAAHLGITGMELLGQLFFRDCPEPHKEDIEAWKDLMWKYGTQTVCHDFFVDKTMYKGRNLTLRESVDIVRRHVKFAAAIDCPIMRIGGTFDPQLFAEAAPICEDYGVKLGVEIHNGSSSWILPDIQETINIIRKKNTRYLGIIPDMSMFQEHIRDSSYFIRGARANGVNPDLIEEMKAFYETDSAEEYVDRCNRMLTATEDPFEKSFIINCRRTENHDPRALLEHMDYIIHIHGKFWEMDDNCEETSINYREVLPILVEGGYNGYISAEYEGAPINGDYFEPQRRYQKMLDKYLGEYPSYPTVTPREAPNADTKVLSNQGYRNLQGADGEVKGFEIYARCFYYRGIPLCLVDRCAVTVDGVRYDSDVISFKVDGETFTFDQMATVQAFYWNYGHLAAIQVALPGGLDPSVSHEVTLEYGLRTYYLPFNHSASATLQLSAIQ